MNTDYLAQYSAELVAQNADGTLELVVESAKIPGLSKVPLRLGLPGCTVKLKRGCRLLVGWENGDPRRPYGALFSASDVEELRIEASVKISVVAPEVNLGDEDGLPVARQGDIVELAVPGTIAVTGTINGVSFVGNLVVGEPLFGVISAPDIRTKAS